MRWIEKKFLLNLFQSLQKVQWILMILQGRVTIVLILTLQTMLKVMNEQNQMLILKILKIQKLMSLTKNLLRKKFLMKKSLTVLKAMKNQKNHQRIVQAVQQVAKLLWKEFQLKKKLNCFVNKNEHQKTLITYLQMMTLLM